MAPLPCDRAGPVTFGSLNQGRKLNAPLFALWARVLRAVPGSRLVIQHVAAHDPAAQRRVRAPFEAAGVDPQRLVFRPFAPPPGYLRSYDTIDIALDSFPYNGGTTTCEALWMGVPVVSRSGGRQVSRLGLSLLSHVGLPELAADSDDGFVAAAVALATDRDHLRRLRATMRQRLLQSPLMDHAGFVRELEQAYRSVWRQWCAQAR